MVNLNHEHATGRHGESSAELRARIADLPPNAAEPDAAATRLLADAVAALALPETAGATIIAVARTIARLDGIFDAVLRIHVAEAISYLPSAALQRLAPQTPPAALRPISEPTPQGQQLVIPGCEKSRRHGPAQLTLW